MIHLPEACSKEKIELSHGCIRVAKPVELAKLLLESDPKWTESKIIEAMHQNEEESVSLGREIPVMILYITYWADSKGNMYFREDLYNRDSEVYSALKETRGFRSGV
jgi:murein L,D-transpeptidase YcbB/YkuD